MTVFNEPARIGDVLKREFDKLFNREQITIISGENLALGTVLGKITKSTAEPSVTPDAGNTGDGTVTGFSVGNGIQLGDYVVTFIEPEADLGKFQVEDPAGKNIGTGEVGTEFSKKGLTFTVNDGATDFEAGDQVVITVAEGSGKYREYDASNSDGSEVAAAILLEAVDASAADADGGVLARGPAVVARSALVGLDDAAEESLLALNIVIRDDIGGDATTY